jgi:hypothetical protein
MSFAGNGVLEVWYSLTREAQLRLRIIIRVLHLLVTARTWACESSVMVVLSVLARLQTTSFVQLIRRSEC